MLPAYALNPNNLSLLMQDETRRIHAEQESWTRRSLESVGLADDGRIMRAIRERRVWFSERAGDPDRVKTLMYVPEEGGDARPIGSFRVVIDGHPF